MNVENLKEILENKIEEIKEPYIRIEEPIFKKIDKDIYAIFIRFFLTGIKHPIFVLTYKIDFRREDKDILESIEKSWTSLDKVLTNLKENISKYILIRKKPDLSYIR
jgi:hypothetical protein